MASERATGGVTSMAALTWRRARAHTGLLVTLVLVIAVAIASLVGLWASATLQTREALSASLPPADTAAGWTQVQTRPADDVAAQQQEGIAVLRGVLGDDVDIEVVTLGEAGSDTERVVWRVTPALSALTPAGMDRLAAGLPDVLPVFRKSSAAVRGVDVSGGLATAVADAAAQVSATTPVLPAPLLLLAVLAWFAIARLARLLASYRGAQNLLLQARGLGGARWSGMALAEAAGVALTGTILGFGATLLGFALFGPPSGVTVIADATGAVLLAVVLATVTLTVVPLRATRLGVATARRPITTGAFAVLLLLIAAVVGWQAVTSSAAGNDPWSVVMVNLAPALVVSAAAVAAILLVIAVLRVSAAAASRTTRVNPALSLRQMARRTRFTSVTVILVVLLLSGSVIAGAFQAMWSAAATRVAALDAGAPLRVTLDRTTPADLAAAAQVTDDVAPVYRAAVSAGVVETNLLAIPADAVPTVLGGVPEVAAQTYAGIVGGAQAVLLPEETTAIDVTAQISVDPVADASVLTGMAVVLDRFGTPTTIRMTAEQRGSTLHVSGDLPAGDGPWSLVSVSLTRPSVLFLSELEVSAPAVLAKNAAGERTDVDIPTVPSTEFPLFTGGTAVIASTAPDTRQIIPAVVTTSLASALGVSAGDPLTLSVDGSGRVIPTTISAIVPELPSFAAASGVVVDLRALVAAGAPTLMAIADAENAPVAANGLWASPPTPSDTISVATGLTAALDAAHGATVETTERPTDTAAGVLGWLWIWSALAGALLAAVALVAVVWADTRDRGGEVVALRALGFSRRALVRLRTTDTLIVVGAGLITGLLVGAGSAALLVPALVARAIGSAGAVVALEFEPWPVVAAAGMLLIAVVVALAGARRILRHQISSLRTGDMGAGEESR